MRSPTTTSSSALVFEHEPELLEQLAGLPNQRTRRQFLARQQGKIDLGLILQIADRARKQLRVDARESLRLSEAAIAIARIVGSELSMAHAIRIKANAKYALGCHPHAVKLYLEAIRRFQACGDETELGRTLSVSILSLNLCGKYDAAFAAAEQAREIFTRLGDELRLARLDINFGNIYYRQDRFTEALDCYQRAYRVVSTLQDVEGMGVVLSNLAVCFISLGQFDEALQTHQEARQVCASYDMPRLVAQADYNIAYLYYLRGEYSRAIDTLRATRDECEQVGDHYHHALCNLDLSELYLELNLSTEAADLAGRAHTEFENLGMGYEKAKSLAFEAIAMSQQGLVRLSLKAFARARAMFEIEKNCVWPSLIDLYRALVLFHEGREDEAGPLAEAALQFFDSSRLPAKAALCRLLLARIAQRAGDLSSARHQCLGALHELKDLQAPVTKQQAFLLMGHIESACGNAKEAYSCFRASRHALEELRSNVRGPELKLAFLKNRLEVYEVLVDACIETGSEASFKEAFSYIEEAKSRTLGDQMLHPGPGANDEGPVGDLAPRIGSIRSELNCYYRLVEIEQLRPDKGSTDRLQRLQAQVGKRERDLVHLLHETSVREKTQLGTLPLQNTALDQIHQVLDADTLLVEYFQSGDRILACLLHRGKLDIVPIGRSSPIGNQLRLLKFQLSKFRLGQAYTEAFHSSLLQTTRAHLKAIYDAVLGPIHDRLDCRHLLIVPHGPLHYVPFHALFDGQRYLIDEHTVSYAPSARIYYVCQKKAVNVCGSTLLMGIPDERAPLIAHEILSLGTILPDSKIYIGAAATEEVLGTEGQDCRIVHVATHGRFRRDNPLFSSIRLGSSYLSVYDLYQLRLSAELVTLSGCMTGLNVVDAGDELIGLARGLFQAGAKSLLLSLWDVHDASAATFMLTFYAHLQRGMDRANAVREAMLQVRERCPHPYHWASFVLMGSYGPLASG